LDLSPLSLLWAVVQTVTFTLVIPAECTTRAWMRRQGKIRRPLSGYDYILRNRYVARALFSWRRLALKIAQCIDFRLFCDPDIPGLWPYEGRIPLRDVVPSTIQVRARWTPGIHYAKNGMETCLTLRARRTPKLTLRLPEVLSGKNPVYDRAMTDADFTTLLEADAGVLSPFGNSSAVIKVRASSRV
jgi:hypothetical protein